jgi:hydroxyacylglutathione hydrolase
MMHSISPIAILKDNYVWAIHQNHYAAIIDPGEAENVQRFLDQHQLKLAAILITHHHGDHTNGITELTNQWDVPVYGSMQESVRGITHPLTANSCVDIASMNLSLSVLSIPGHTRGHIAYYGHDF